MNRILSLAAALALACGSSAYAADMASAPMSGQQSKMSDCSKANKGKKGDDYKSAMKSCLSGDSAMAAPAKPMTQQEKMAACSKQNKGKKGDDYKSAQKACLSA